MKLFLVACVVICLFLKETSGANCMGNWQTCSNFDHDKNCCNGYACKYWSLTERRCQPANHKLCKTQGERCGMFTWCCDDLTCENTPVGNERVCKKLR